MSFAKKLLIWAAVSIIGGWLIRMPWWAIALTFVIGWAVLAFLDHRNFRHDFILSFERWNLSEYEAAAIVTKFARRVGNTCIQQERGQQELALMEKEELVLGPVWRRFEQKQRLKKRIEVFGDLIREYKEEWITAKRLFMRRFPQALEPLHWSEVEPYYTQGRGRASLGH